MDLLCFLWLKIHYLIKFLLSEFINSLGIVLRFLCQWPFDQWCARWGAHSLLRYRLLPIWLSHYIGGQNAAMCRVDKRYGHLLYSHLLTRLSIRHHISRMLFSLIKLRQGLILKQMKLTSGILYKMTRRGSGSTIIVWVADYHTGRLLYQCGCCAHG